MVNDSVCYLEFSSPEVANQAKDILESVYVDHLKDGRTLCILR